MLFRGIKIGQNFSSQKFIFLAKEGVPTRPKGEISFLTQQRHDYLEIEDWVNATNITAVFILHDLVQLGRAASNAHHRPCCSRFHYVNHTVCTSTSRPKHVLAMGRMDCESAFNY